MVTNPGMLPRQNSSKTKALITGGVAVFIFGLLYGEHLQGGVASHHILGQENLPAISNWWGGVLLPVLTWFLVGRTEKRLTRQAPQVQPRSLLQNKVLGLFLAGVLLGVLIATAFTNGYNLFLDSVPLLIVALSLLIPIYYAEFILGFILAMTYTFGALLPTIFILMLAAIGFLTYRFIRPAILKLARKVRDGLRNSPNH